VADLGSSDTAQKVAEEEAQTGSDERP
jgi:hypothetical protein